MSPHTPDADINQGRGNGKVKVCLIRGGFASIVPKHKVAYCTGPPIENRETVVCGERDSISLIVVASPTPIFQPPTVTHVRMRASIANYRIVTGLKRTMD
jgi:hypothetical protein